MLKQAGPFDLIVCSYGLLQSEGERLAEVEWETIVADEAQAFKNALTKRSRAIKQLRGGFRLITMGTPIENHLGELWNLFSFINPGLLGSLKALNQRFAVPIEQDKDQATGRAHRIGQQRQVTVYRLVAKGTIEERILALHGAKRDLADDLLEGTQEGGRLSFEDLMALVG